MTNEADRMTTLYMERFAMNRMNLDNFTFSDNSYLEPPDDEGAIRRFDVHGNCEGIRRPGDADWQEWADLFTRVVELPVHNIRIHVVGNYVVGKIESDIGNDVIESFILACACAGVEVESPAFLEAVETTVEAVANHDEPSRGACDECGRTLNVKDWTYCDLADRGTPVCTCEADMELQRTAR